MREIKFRAWDKQNHKLYVVKNLQFWTRDGEDGFDVVINCDEEEWLFPPDFEIMQYTGLNDKNGKEIYEGDILQLADGKENPHWQVVWYENGWHIKQIHPQNYHVRISSTRVLEFDEVIGNIYENLELIQEGK